LPAAPTQLYTLSLHDALPILPYAKKLAELHLADDGLTSLIVTPEQVYNEFSGGVPDAAALRNFIRMIRERGMQSGQQTRYLLLLDRKSTRLNSSHVKISYAVF